MRGRCAGYLYGNNSTVHFVSPIHHHCHFAFLEWRLSAWFDLDRLFDWPIRVHLVRGSEVIVECIDSTPFDDALTVGKHYKVVRNDESSDYTEIVDDRGCVGGYKKRRFKEVPQVERTEVWHEVKDGNYPDWIDEYRYAWFRSINGHTYVELTQQRSIHTTHFKPIKNEVAPKVEREFSDDGRYWCKGEYIGEPWESDGQSHLCRLATGAVIKWRYMR